MKNILILALGSFVFVSCGKKEEKTWEQSSSVIQTAPQSEKDLGYIIESPETPEAVLSAVEELQAQIRPISETLGFYEVYGVSLSELSEKIEIVSAEKNKMISLQKDRSLEDAIAKVLQKASKENEKCELHHVMGPKAELRVMAQGKLVETGSILSVKEPVQIGSIGSSLYAPDAKNKGQLVKAKPQVGEFYYQVIAPRGSRYQQMMVSKDEAFQFSPDLPGEYTIVYVIRDQFNRCGLASVNFGVTINTPKSSNVVARSFTSQDRNLFYHLDMIGAVEARQVATGKGSVVAIVDSGVNYNHPDLSQNILVSGGSYGFDFVHNDRFAMDDNGHGTHVAGIAASAVSGIAPDAKILPVKAMSALGTGDMGTIAKAIEYAIQRKSDVINLSLGGESRSFPTVMKKVMELAQSQNIVVVAAAGNGAEFIENGKRVHHGFDIDPRPVYPASIHTPNMIVVAAAGRDQKLTNYTNYGVRTVDIVAPGGTGTTASEGIVAAHYLPQVSMYVAMPGTSMASPVVSGAIASLKEKYPHLSATQLITLVMKTGNKLPEYQGKVRSGALLNLKNALSARISIR